MRSVLVLAILAGAVVAGGADKAAALLKQGEAKKAAAAAQKLVAKDAANIDAWLVLADAHVKLDDPAEAWTALEGAIEKNPEEARLSLKLADVFVKMAEREQRTTNDGTAITNYYLDAERMYDEAFGKDPRLPDAVYGKAFVNFYLNRREKAKKYVADCLGMKKDHPKALALQAFMFYGERKYPEAQRLYEISLKLDDSDPVNMVRYGHTFYAQGKNDEAKAAYIACLKRHPENATPITSGLYYASGKDWRRMGPALKEASKAAPNSSQVWYYLGYVEFINDNTKEAKAAFTKAEKLQPKNAQYAYYVGYCVEKLGDARKALAQYRKALKRSPDYIDAMARFQGIIVGMRTDIDTADKLYEELLELAPNNGWIRNDYALHLRNWGEARGAARMARPAPEVRRRIKRSGEVYEMAAALLPKEAQVQSDCGLLFEFYPCNRDDKKAEKYFSEALVISEWTYRDAWSGIRRLCMRTKKWELLKDHAEGVIGALEGRGLQVVAPVGGGAPRELKNQTPMILEQAKAALKIANKNLGVKEGE